MVGDGTGGPSEQRHVGTPGVESLADGQLEQALRGAHMPTLLMVLMHLTGDKSWLSERYRPARPRGGRDPDDGGLPEEVQEEIRDEAAVTVRRWRDGLIEPMIPSQEELYEMMSFSIGADIDPETVPMVAEEIGLADRDEGWALSRVAAGRTGMRVVIVGAGMSGLCMAAKLEKVRIPYVIIERNAAVGGTWTDNKYPGVGVDTPCTLYQLSFERYAEWSEYYSKRPEIQAYFERVADTYCIRDKIRFRTEVVSAVWDESRRIWEVEVADASGGREILDANVVVTSVGTLNQPKVPDIAGADSFAGPAMHTAAWDTEVEYAGKRVAVIGTGASAMQLVPAMAGVAEKVTVFQRSPQWAVPNPDYKRAVSNETKWLLAHLPFYSGWYRYRQFWMWNDNIYPTLQIDPDWPHQDRSINQANEAQRTFLTKHIESKLTGRPDLLKKCLPTYPPYGKRMLMDNDWFETMRRDDVELVTEKVATITQDGISTVDGIEYPVDIIAYATGFHAHRMLYPMDIRGRGETGLRDVWGDEDARAYLGISAPEFPNLFFIYGPQTNLGHGGSIVFHTELQVRYVMSMLRKMLDRDITSVEVRGDVHDDYIERLDATHERMIWTHRGVDSWYQNTKGQVNLSPWRLVDYWKMTREPDLTEFTITHD
ncbi:MAG: SidA/IucD/PvdA family monooxygenase [Pseudonocardiaceae bacterium]|nr:SidA/IucD/PvdA family monooxygenase [Pseudonocardiaceae bacterium]